MVAGARRHSGPDDCVEDGLLDPLVAIAGTTISSYLFFWQASEEAEDARVGPQRAALIRAGRQAPAAFAGIRADTLAVMAFSNVIAVSIMITTGQPCMPRE